MRLAFALALLLPSIALAQGRLTDPGRPPVLASDLWRVVLNFRDGEVTLAEVARERVTPPETLARFAGRFEAALLDGSGASLDAFRFNFPLLGGEPEIADAFARRMRSSITLRLPALETAVALRVTDRRSRREWRFALPRP